MKPVAVLLACLLPALALAEVRVIDGDTLDMDGTIYRLNGIDAPEHGQTCGGWACGKASTETLVELVKGRDIACDPVSRDGYGRIVATCYADGADIGAQLIDKGLAWAFVKYSDTYARREAAARRNARGIWTGRFTPPWEYREDRWRKATAAAPRGCPIKGNISRNGHIYHAPWSPWYSRTRISPSKGERWFCSEAEAIAAGWRAPYWN